MRITAGDSMPPTCFNCGQHTDRQVQVHRSKATEADDGAVATGVIASLLSLLLGGISFWSSRSREYLMVHVPQCDLCAADGPPAPRHVDFGNERMTFVVHKSFKEAAASGSRQGQSGTVSDHRSS